jgi:hypothetical protein
LTLLYIYPIQRSPKAFWHRSFAENVRIQSRLHVQIIFGLPNSKVLGRENESVFLIQLCRCGLNMVLLEVLLFFFTFHNSPCFQVMQGFTKVACILCRISPSLIKRCGRRSEYMFWNFVDFRDQVYRYTITF